MWKYDVSKAYSKKKVNNLHNRQNHISDFGLVIAVTRDHESAGNEMVGEHLPVVFPSFLYVDNKDLLHPKGELHEIIPLHGTFDFSVWPASPHLFHVEPVLMGVHDVLHLLVSCRPIKEC